MIRNLKFLGLALVAVFAFSAMAASAASAQNGIITSDGPFTLSGVNRAGSAESENALTAFGQEVNCPNATYTGHKVNVTPHEKIANNSSAATITPTYGTCKIGGTIKATVDMNGCDYVFHLGATTGVTDQYKVTATVVCPTGKHIVLTLFTNSTFHANNSSFCHITITEAASYDGLTVTDNTNNTFTVGGEIKNISADKEVISGTSGPDVPTILCPSETTATAVLKLSSASRVGSCTEPGDDCGWNARPGPRTVA
jgi:hypothetical protein